MNKITNQTYLKQAYYLSIASVITSFVFGMGIIFSIPCLVYTLYIKKRDSSLNNDLIDQCVFFSVVGMVLSLFFLLFEMSMFLS